MYTLPRNPVLEFMFAGAAVLGAPFNSTCKNCSRIPTALAARRCAQVGATWSLAVRTGRSSRALTRAWPRAMLPRGNSVRVLLARRAHAPALEPALPGQELRRDGGMHGYECRSRCGGSCALRSNQHAISMQSACNQHASGSCAHPHATEHARTELPLRDASENAHIERTKDSS